MSMLLSATCRVCLASEREMHRIANTALEETYERVTSGTLVVEGRPSCVCGVCLSALRRCRRFIDTAREANDALDRWIRNHPNTDTLTESPLFFFTRSAMNIFEITCQESGIQEPGVKLKRDTAEIESFEMIHHQNKGTPDDEGNILNEEIKCEVTSDDDNDNTQMSDNIESHNTQVLSNSECINTYDNMIDIVQYDISEMIDEVNDVTAPGVSTVRKTQKSSDEDISLQILLNTKRVRLSDDTKSGPAPKKRKPTTSEDQPGNTDPAAALHEEDTFLCHHCNTTHKYRLNKNLRYPIEKPTACDKCSQKSILKQHLLTHSNEKPFACEKCAYKCIKKDDFERHLLRHNVEKAFSCDHCDYKCSSRTRLKQHLSEHSNEKPFACEKCAFKCKRKANFERHLWSHGIGKPFSCDYCGYKSSFRVRLREHLLTHDGDEKPYTCDKCDYKYKNEGSLIKHLLVHGPKQFSCDKCNYKSIRKSNLNRHLNSAHCRYANRLQCFFTQVSPCFGRHVKPLVSATSSSSP